ncbi:MAG: DUF6541 family protein [Candidatus Omnitrophota bacterium]
MKNFINITRQLIIIALSIFCIISFVGILHSFNFITLTTRISDIPSSIIKQENKEKNFCYIFSFHKSFGDNNSSPFSSKVMLMENGTPLKSGHSLHQDIKDKGKGRYSHWTNYVLFSSSDNSDPRINGRSYSVLYPPFTGKRARNTFPKFFLLSLVLLTFALSFGKIQYLTRINWPKFFIDNARYSLAWPQIGYSRKQLIICLVILFVCGVFIHLLSAFGGPIILMPDSGSYLCMAKDIREGCLELCELYLERVPGYGFFIYFIENIFKANSSLGLKLVQHFLGLSVCILTFLCALMLTRRIWFALAASISSLLSLQVVSFNNWVMTESLYSFVLMLTVTSCLYAVKSRKDWFFLITMVLCAVLAWIKSSARLIWIALLIFWFFWLIWRVFKNAGKNKFTFKYLIKNTFNLKNIIWPVIGTILYLGVISPQLISNHRVMGKITLGSGEGFSLWQGVFSYRRLENVKNNEFIKFVEDFNKWVTKKESIPKLFIDLKLDWRNTYFALVYLRAEKKMKSYEASDWMLKISKDAINNNKFKYFYGIINDIKPQLTNYDISTFFVTNAENYRSKYPWAMDLMKVIEPYRENEWGKDYFKLQENDSALKPLWLKISSFYNYFIMKSAHCEMVWFLIILGMIVGLFFFNRVGYLLILGIIAYHVLLPLIPQQPIPRFRYPVNGLLSIIIMAGPWFIMLFFREAQKKINGEISEYLKVKEKEVINNNKKTKLFFNERMFGIWGILITLLVIFLIRTFGILEKGPYFLDEVSINLPALQLFFNESLVSIHPHAGALFILGVVHKIFFIEPTYSSALMFINIFVIISAVILYIFIKSWTNNNVLAWLSSFMYAGSGPLIFSSYMLYGTSFAYVFILFSACFMVDNIVKRKNTNRFYFYLIGLFGGAAYTSHESIFPMVCAIFITMLFFSMIQLVKDKMKFSRIIFVLFIFMVGFFTPILFFNNIIPIYYKLAAGMDFKELVTRYFLDFGFSGESKNYLGAILEPWQRLPVNKLPRISMLISTIYVACGWFIPAVAFLGIYYGFKEKSTRLLTFSFIFMIFVWFIGASFASVFVMRLVVPAVIIMSIFAAFGVYQIYLWASKLIFLSNKENVKIVVSFVLALLLFFSIYPGMKLAFKSKTAYQEMIDHSVRNNFNFDRILSTNHLAAWYFLRNDIIIPKSSQEIKKNYDYIIVEPANYESLFTFKAYLARAFEGVAPVATFKNSLGGYDYYPAEGSFEAVRFIRNNSNINGLARDKLYIFKISDAKF